MLFVELAQKFLLAVSYTSYLIDEHPVSCMIVGKPASGKSAIIKQINGKLICEPDDISVTGIRQEYIKKMQEYYHYKFHDFTKIIRHRSSIRNEILSEIALASEDGAYLGLYRGSAYDRTKDGAMWIGFMLGITYTVLEQLLRFSSGTGFASRLLYFYMGYTDVHKAIIDELQSRRDIIQQHDIIHVNHIIAPVDVIISDNTFEQLTILSKKLGQVNSDYRISRTNDNGKIVKYGIEDNFSMRTKNQLRKLAKGIALMNQRREVIQEDVDLIKQFMPYMGLRQEEEYAKL